MTTKATDPVLNLVSPPISDMILLEGTLNNVNIGLSVPGPAVFNYIGSNYIGAYDTVYAAPNPSPPFGTVLEGVSPGPAGYSLISNGSAAPPSYQQVNLLGPGVTGLPPAAEVLGWSGGNWINVHVGAGLSWLQSGLTAELSAIAPPPPPGTPGRLLNVVIVSVPGTYTYNPTAGANTVIFHIIGGGGGGGGSDVTDSVSVAAGVSGGGGGYCWAVYSAPAVAGETMIIGVGGNGGNGGSLGNDGTNGASSAFGAMTAGGGEGGRFCHTTAGAITNTAASAGGSASGGNFNLVGGASTASLLFPTPAAPHAVVGMPGFNPWSSNALAFAVDAEGVAGNGFGGGGSGGMSAPNSGGHDGGNGAHGAAIYYEYS